MRKLLVLFAAVGIGWAFPSCTNPGPAGVFADAQWAVRCETMGMCPGASMRDVNGFNGERGLSVTCSTVETESTRTVSFRAFSATQYGIELRSGIFPRSGGSPSGAGCRFIVRDDPNTYEGSCGGGTPSPAQPCQISNVQFTTHEMTGAPLIRGDVLCRGISPTAAPSIMREVTARGDSSMPFTFFIYDCPGYHP